MPSDRRPATLDPLTLTPRQGSSYPERFKAGTAARLKRVLGDALGLSHFGVNLVQLPPGSESALRHWHSDEDEFVYILEGEATLVTDEGPQILGPGMTAGFPAGVANGHHLVNRGGETVVYLEIGDRVPGDRAAYPDDDLQCVFEDGKHKFSNRNGEPY